MAPHVPKDAQSSSSPDARAVEARLTPGERALMIAVLEDAIRCYLGLVHYDRTNPKILARQAEYWIRLDDWDSPFSFNNICESLGLHHERARETVLEWESEPRETLEERIRSIHNETSIFGRAGL